ncbi:hypothetical protein [Pigmentiphaga sp. CHJ604]|uniref:hypothetical protein n=1 Tax=Pigmentiphaga sp. CHJ604 TaxID=3081984 RepID=UPI0030D4F387
MTSVAIWLRSGRWQERLRWHAFLARRVGQRLGVPGIAGCLLLVAAGWLAAVDIPRARLALDLAAKDLSALPEIAVPESAPVALLAQIRPRLEGPSDLEALPADLVDAFATAGVQVNEASFTAVSQKIRQDLTKTQIVGTLQGRYPAIKAGLSKVLEQHPTLALNALSLNQTLPQEGVVDARLHFTHWSRAERSMTRD